MLTKRFIVLEKAVGETPLQVLEKFRSSRPDLELVPMAYAGRLDPMASGKLLILIGEECKQQDKYFGLDKEYEFEVLFGVSSDTADVLGLITPSSRSHLELDDTEIKTVCKKLVGKVELPYPHFSSKTVQGKPLHVWTLEGRLDEITIPTKQSEIHQLELLEIYKLSKDEIYKSVTEKIETIPPVTDPSKALGNDFRRPLVRESWKNWLNNSSPRQGLGLGITILF